MEGPETSDHDLGYRFCQLLLSSARNIFIIAAQSFRIVGDQYLDDKIVKVATALQDSNH
jgi:hypothetical protein